MSSPVGLRPVTSGDLERLVRWVSDASVVGEMTWSGYRAAVGLRRRYETDGFLGDDDGWLMVEHAGEAVGFVTWRAVDTYGRPPASRCWSIGISLLPAWRGRGLGGPAQRELTDYLLATTTVERVEACTDVDNHREQRALEEAGFRREGVVRGAQFRAGQWRDLVLYSRLRSDGDT